MTNSLARKMVVVGMMLMLMLSFVLISLPSGVSGLGYGTTNDPIWPEFFNDPSDPGNERAGGWLGAYGPTSGGWLPDATVYGQYSQWYGTDYSAYNYRVQVRHDSTNDLYQYSRAFFVFDTRFLSTHTQVDDAEVALRGVGIFSNDTTSNTFQNVGTVDLYVFELPECVPGVPNGKICNSHTYPAFDTLFAPANYIGNHTGTGGGTYDISVNFDPDLLVRNGFTCVGVMFNDTVEGAAPTAGGWSRVDFQWGSGASGDTDYGLFLEVGAPVDIIYNGDTANATGVHPIISELDDGRDLYTIEFETWTGITNVTLRKHFSSEWAYLSSSPYTGTLTVTDDEIDFINVIQGVTYRVYFAVLKGGDSNVYLYPYSSDTGVGYPFETFRYKYSVGDEFNASTALDIYTSPTLIPRGQTVTIGALDYFENVLNEITIRPMVDNMILEIPIDTYSFKVMNAHLDEPIRVDIYFNRTGEWVGPHAFYSGPGEVVERFFRDGDYRIQITYYDSGGNASDSVYFYYTIDGDPSYLLISDGRIDQLITSSEGMLRYQRIITQYVTPDIVYMAYNVPFVPDEDIELVCPWSIITATSRMNDTGDDMDFAAMQPDDATVISDRMWFSGPAGTTVYVNDTNSSDEIFNGTIISFIDLEGENVTVESSANIMVIRETRFRVSELFNYEYRMSIRQYTAAISADNEGAHDWTNVHWSIGFPENRTIDTSSVRVYDLDNAAYLTAGLHYDVTQSGVRMMFDSIDAGESRSMRFTMYDANATQVDRVPMVTAEGYVAAKYEGESYQLTSPQWVNTFPSRYDGELRIKLDFENARHLKNIVVVDRTNDVVLSPGDWIYSGDIITIAQVSVPVSGMAAYDIYFLIDYSEIKTGGIFEPLIGPINLAHILIFLCAAMGAWTYSAYSHEKFYLFIMFCLGTGVLILLSWGGWL